MTEILSTKTLVITDEMLVHNCETMTYIMIFYKCSGPLSLLSVPIGAFKSSCVFLWLKRRARADIMKLGLKSRHHHFSVL